MPAEKKEKTVLRIFFFRLQRDLRNCCKWVSKNLVMNIRNYLSSSVRVNNTTTRPSNTHVVMHREGAPSTKRHRKSMITGWVRMNNKVVQSV